MPYHVTHISALSSKPTFDFLIDPQESQSSLHGWLQEKVFNCRNDDDMVTVRSKEEISLVYVTSYSGRPACGNSRAARLF